MTRHEIRRLVTISTAHIPVKEANYWEDNALYTNDYGFIVPVDWALSAKDDVPVSAKLAQLFKDKGIAQMNFDCDIETHESLAEYDWSEGE